VEYHWLPAVFLGHEDEGMVARATEDDPDPEMRLAVDIPLSRLLTEYEEQSARFGELVAAHDLDTRARRPDRTAPHAPYDRRHGTEQVLVLSGEFRSKGVCACPTALQRLDPSTRRAQLTAPLTIPPPSPAPHALSVPPWPASGSALRT
jgi:hypothetical protein